MGLPGQAFRRGIAHHLNLCFSRAEGPSDVVLASALVASRWMTTQSGELLRTTLSGRGVIRVSGEDRIHFLQVKACQGQSELPALGHLANRSARDVPPLSSERNGRKYTPSYNCQSE